MTKVQNGMKVSSSIGAKVQYFENSGFTIGEVQQKDKVLILKGCRKLMT